MCEYLIFNMWYTCHSSLIWFSYWSYFGMLGANIPNLDTLTMWTYNYTMPNLDTLRVCLWQRFSGCLPNCKSCKCKVHFRKKSGVAEQRARGGGGWCIPSPQSTDWGGNLKIDDYSTSIVMYTSTRKGTFISTIQLQSQLLTRDYMIL